jgi:hypothetical protein
VGVRSERERERERDPIKLTRSCVDLLLTIFDLVLVLPGYINVLFLMLTGLSKV